MGGYVYEIKMLKYRNALKVIMDYHGVGAADVSALIEEAEKSGVLEYLLKKSATSMSKKKKDVLDKYAKKYGVSILYLVLAAIAYKIVKEGENLKKQIENIEKMWEDWPEKRVGVDLPF